MRVVAKLTGIWRDEGNGAGKISHVYVKTK